MLYELKTYAVVVALAVLSASILLPLLARAFRQMRKQGIFFALIGAGFLTSMATKPTTAVIKAEPVEGAAKVVVLTNGCEVSESSVGSHCYVVTSGECAKVVWNANDGYQFPGPVGSYTNSVLVNWAADTTNTVVVSDDQLPGVYLKGVRIDQDGPIVLTVGATTNLTFTLDPATGAATNSVAWASSASGVATVDEASVSAMNVGTADVTLTVGDRLGNSISDTISVTVIQPLVEVVPQPAEGAKSFAVYTNSVSDANAVPGSPYYVRSNDTVFVVWKADEGYLFGEGCTAYTNSASVTESQQEFAIPKDDLPQPVTVEIAIPASVAGLVYSGDNLIGVTNVDTRLSIVSGITNATDAVSTNAVFRLPKMGVTNFVWKGASEGRAKADVTNDWSVAKRSITLKSASATKVYDGAPLSTNGVDVVDGSYAGDEAFAYKVTGKQTEIGWSTNFYTFADNDDTTPKTKVANYAVTQLFGTLTVTEKPTVLVKADAVTGASVLAAYTNGTVQVTGSSPWTVYTNEAVKVVYQADEDYVFKDGASVFTNSVTASEATTTATLSGGQLPIVVVKIAIDVPAAVEGLVYGGTDQIGITNVDARLTVGEGLTNATDAVSTNCVFALPEDNVFTNYAFKGEVSDRSVTVDWSIAPRPITLKSASATKVCDGTPLSTNGVEVVDGSYAGDEVFVYKVTGSQTEIGWSTNFYTFADNDGTTPKTKVANYAVTQEYGILTVTEKLAQTVGRYLELDLEEDLGVEIPSDVDYTAGDKVTIKIEGLAKGLKLVTTPIKITVGGKSVLSHYVYTIYGVPTEAIDVATQPMFARVTTTYKDKTKGKVETLTALKLTIKAAEVRSLNAGVLSGVYGPVDIATLWPEVADAEENPKDWTFKGWPAGILYNNTAKEKAWTYKVDGVQMKTNAPAWSVYGIPTKAGEYALTATHKRKLEDGKTTVSETLSATLTVWGDECEKAYRYTDRAYVETATKLLSATYKSFSGLPTGIKYTTKPIAADLRKGTPAYEAYSLYGTPTKAGVYAVTATMTDPLNPKKTVKETFLWKVTEGTNEGFLGSIDWKVEDSTVTVMQGVIQTNWNVTVDAAAKVTASGLPTGLKLAQNRLTGEWYLEGTPTKTGNFVVTFKTVLNGVTKTERIAMAVTENAYTGSWYAAPFDNHSTSWTAYISVAAGGTVKLTLTEGTTNTNAKGVIQSQVSKTTVTAKNFDGDGKSVYFTLPRDKKVTGSVDRSCVVDFDEKTIKINGEEQSAYIYYQAPFDFDVPEVATMVLEEFVEDEVAGNSTNAFAYLTATYNAAKGLVGVQGKLYDGTAVKATTYALEEANGGSAPFLVTDKSKNSISFLISYTANKGKGEFRLMQCAVFVNGQLLRVGKASLNPSWDGFDSTDAKLLKSTKFSDMTSATNLVLLVDAESSPRQEELFIPIPVKSLATKLTAQGLVAFKNLKDADGVSWTCELLPTGEMKEGATPFRGIATGTWKNPVTRKTETFTCPVRTE